MAFTSLLKRSVQTFNIIAEETNHHHIPVIKSWRLNEKHYGALQGLNKTEMIHTYGHEQIRLWTRSYSVSPPPLAWNDIRNAFGEEKYRMIAKELIPMTEV
jgi:2,3-bisphosphoglycerate-dependent phosphoglycerate mutase